MRRNRERERENKGCKRRNREREREKKQLTRQRDEERKHGDFEDVGQIFHLFLLDSFFFCYVLQLNPSLDQSINNFFFFFPSSSFLLKHTTMSDCRSLETSRFLKDSEKSRRNSDYRSNYEQVLTWILSFTSFSFLSFSPSKILTLNLDTASYSYPDFCHNKNMKEMKRKKLKKKKEMKKENESLCN